MFNINRDKDTICAVASASGTGGIAVIRVTGLDAVLICNKILPFLDIPPSSHKVKYGFCVELHTREPIDEVLVTYFKKGRSFTTEDTVEISCHGSQSITQQIISELVKAGARVAERGEFTYRAFMGGRIDLIQAESVLSLVESDTKRASRMALGQLGGNFSKTIACIENSLEWVLAHFEANIDFSEEEIDIAAQDEICDRLKKADIELSNLVDTYDHGRLVSDGVNVCLVGRPNVGKSSLLNSLMGSEKAIVTEIAGTTRDIVEGHFLVDGYKVNLFDTAGLRSTEDPVEVLGIERTLKKISECDLVVWVIDLVDFSFKCAGSWLNLVPPDRLLILGNKIDLVESGEQATTFSKLSLLQVLGEKLPSLCSVIKNVPDKNIFPVSAYTEKNLEKIGPIIKEVVDSYGSESSAVVMQARHFELLNKSITGVRKTIKVLEEDVSPEFLVFELKESLICLQELLGKVFDDQIMDRVFKEFCLGK